MGAETQKLHVAFFPLMAAGHMIPILDIAKLFASHHVKTTIITTPLNAPFFTKPIETFNNNLSHPLMDVEIIPFPSEEAGLPKGVENFDQFDSDEGYIRLFKAIDQLVQESLEQVLEKIKPNCLVADLLLPFATDIAAKFNIPRLVFHGTNYLAKCVSYSMFKYEPYKCVSSINEEFVIPHLPYEIKVTLSKLPEFMRGQQGYSNEVSEEFMKILGRAGEAEGRSFGVIVNSFNELEPEFVDYYREVVGRRAWSIGPVSLCNRENEAKFQRGKDPSIDEHECLMWLDSKKPNSVVYVCFGSLVEVSASQLREIALGLEASEQEFIWVVRRSDKSDDEEWLPHEFEKRMEGKGLIIKGWAPQVMILDHEATGAFVTHCGWNSTLEGLSCGVPMITWPVFAEQFYNEYLVVDILKTGISVGAKEWNRKLDSNLKCEDIKEVIKRIMIGEEGLEIRSRANEVKEMARKAVEIGGSSYCNMQSLIHELRSYNAGGC